MNQRYEDIMNSAGIRITSNRLLVLKALHENMQGAFSFSDVKRKMPYMDESSVFRALTLFADKHLLHCIDDGSGKQKYCVCRCQEAHNGCGHHHDHIHHHGHVHLTCVRCHETICLDHVLIPSVTVPSDFQVIESEYIIKGICPKCKARKKDVR